MFRGLYKKNCFIKIKNQCCVSVTFVCAVKMNPIDEALYNSLFNISEKGTYTIETNYLAFRHVIKYRKKIVLTYKTNTPNRKLSFALTNIEQINNTFPNLMLGYYDKEFSIYDPVARLEVMVNSIVLPMNFANIGEVYGFRVAIREEMIRTRDIMIHSMRPEFETPLQKLNDIMTHLRLQRAIEVHEPDYMYGLNKLILLTQADEQEPTVERVTILNAARTVLGNLEQETNRPDSGFSSTPSNNITEEVRKIIRSELKRQRSNNTQQQQKRKQQQQPHQRQHQSQMQQQHGSQQQAPQSYVMQPPVMQQQPYIMPQSAFQHQPYAMMPQPQPMYLAMSPYAMMPTPQPIYSAAQYHYYQPPQPQYPVPMYQQPATMVPPPPPPPQIEPPMPAPIPVLDDEDEIKEEPEEQTEATDPEYTELVSFFLLYIFSVFLLLCIFSSFSFSIFQIRFNTRLYGFATKQKKTPCILNTFCRVVYCILNTFCRVV